MISADPRVLLGASRVSDEDDPTARQIYSGAPETDRAMNQEAAGVGHTLTPRVHRGSDVRVMAVRIQSHVSLCCCLKTHDEHADVQLEGVSQRF